LIDEYRLRIHPVVLGAGERLFNAPLTIEPISTTAFSGGAVAHVFAAHPWSSPIGNRGADAVTTFGAYAGRRRASTMVCSLRSTPNAETLAAGAAMAASSSPVPQAMSARRSPRCVVSAVIDALRLDPRLGPRA
jgi:hypothetical protein